MLAPVGVHEVDLGAAEERDRPPVGRPGRSVPVARQPPLPASVGVHDVDAVDAVAHALEGERPPVGRPGRSGGVARVARQPPLPAPVGVHDVERLVAVAPAQEGDPPPVGRPDRSLNVGPPGWALDQLEEATADAERRRNEQPAHEDHGSDSDHAPARGSRRTPPGFDVRAKQGALSLGCLLGKRKLAGNLGHLSAILSGSISTCLCRGAPSSSAGGESREARARERRERTVPTGTPRAAAASS